MVVDIRMCGDDTELAENSDGFCALRGKVPVRQQEAECLFSGATGLTRRNPAPQTCLQCRMQEAGVFSRMR